MSNRPETGPMRFGSDWTGIFIRGDNAAYFAHQLEHLLDLVKKADIQEATIPAAVVRGLLSDLQGVDERRGIPKDCQYLRAFDECLPPPKCSGCGQVITGPHGCPGK